MTTASEYNVYAGEAASTAFCCAAHALCEIQCLKIHPELSHNMLKNCYSKPIEIKLRIY